MSKATAAALILSFSASGAWAMLGVGGKGSPRDLVVQYKTGTHASARLPANSVALDALKPGLRVLHYTTEEALAAAFQAFASDPNVESVHRAQNVSAAYTPNDADYPQQWDKIIQHLEAADAVETGQAPVLVLIVDTGYDCSQHPDLAPNCRQDLSRNFISDPSYFWHAWHVNGIVAASINNAIDTAGTAGTVEVAFARFLDSTGNGSTADALAAWNYAIQLQQQGYQVIVNNSWGGGGDDPSLRAAATAMKQAGVWNIAAAGNNHTDNCSTPFYPAAYPEVLAVAASDNNDALASFSNFGPCVWIAAPGVNITSLSVGTNGAPPPETGMASGTSMAAPQLSGALALLRSQQPNLTQDQAQGLIEAAALPKGLNVKSGRRLDLGGLLGPAKPGFRLSIQQCPTPAVVDAGATMNCVVSPAAVGGFVDPVTLSASGIPNAAVTFSPPTITPGSTSTMSLTPPTSITGRQLADLVVTGSADSGTVTNTAHRYVTIYPPGTAPFNYAISTPQLWFGNCSDPTPVGQGCPWPPWNPGGYLSTVSSPIAVPHANYVIHLSGSVNISWQGYPLSATLVSPKGTVYTIPLPGLLVTPSGGDYAFDTDAFDGEPAQGNWTMTIDVGAQGNWWGHLNSWKMTQLAAPLSPPPPPPPPPNSPTADWPGATINWTSQNAAACSINGASVPLSGSRTVTEPYGTYTLSCDGATKKLTIGVQ